MAATALTKMTLPAEKEVQVSPRPGQRGRDGWIGDACVLNPAPLRNFLMWPGLSGRFRARCSLQIHDEWKRNLMINRPDLTRAQLDRTSGLMDPAIPDGLVWTATLMRFCATG